METFNFRWIDQNLEYQGKELRPHFLLTQFEMKGSSIAAWIGPCSVKTQDLVDWEDRLAKSTIQAKLMLHFVGEFFNTHLKEGVLLQRLFIANVLEILHQKGAVQLIRKGDDLFLGNQKLSVSILTTSPVSQLLHLGLNIDPSGAPVPAVGLGELFSWKNEELKENARNLSETILKRFQAEVQGMNWACAKVRPVF